MTGGEDVSFFGGKERNKETCVETAPVPDISAKEKGSVQGIVGCFLFCIFLSRETGGDDAPYDDAARLEALRASGAAPQDFLHSR